MNNFKSSYFKYLFPRKEINFMNNNRIETMYTTKDYKIKFIRIPKFYNQSDYKFICYIEIYNILDILITKIKCTEIDIIKILDTMQYSLSNNCETYSFFNNIDSIGNYNGIKLNLNYNLGIFNYSISILEYNYNNESVINLCNINFNDFSDIYNFLDLMYMTFLVNDIDITQYTTIQDCLLSDEFNRLDYDY